MVISLLSDLPMTSVVFMGERPLSLGGPFIPPQVHRSINGAKAGAMFVLVHCWISGEEIHK